MFVTSATPRELVDWFHRDHHGQSVLCVLLAPAQVDQDKLLAIVRDLYETDAILGAEVAFILLHPNAEQIVALAGLGSMPVLRGAHFPQAEQFMRTPRPLRDTGLFIDESTQNDFVREDMALQSARAMARFVPDFMKLFAVRPHELPALCVLVRGLNESVTVPLPKVWGKADLQELFRQLQACASDAREVGRSNYALLKSARLDGALLQQGLLEINAKKAKLTALMDGLLFRHKATPADRQIVANFLASETAQAATFSKVLARLTISESERFRKDGRIGKAQGILYEIESIKAKVEPVSMSDYLDSLGVLIETVAAKRAHLLANIQQIRNGRVVGTMNPKYTLEQAERHLGWVERLVGVGQKGGEILRSLRKLLETSFGSN